jgi:hypothetical protein
MLRPQGFGLHSILMAPEDGGAGGTGSGAGTPKPEAKPAEPAAPSAAEIAELRAAKAQLDTINAGKAAAEAEALKLRAAAAKEAEGKGELQKALDIQKARLAELEPYEAEVKTFRDMQAAELKAIEDRKPSLTEAQRAAIDQAPTLAAKKAFLAAFGDTKEVHKPASNGTTPAPAGVVDFDEAFKDPKSFAEAKVKDPKGYEAWQRRAFSQGRQPSSLDNLFRTKAAS